MNFNDNIIIFYHENNLLYLRISNIHDLEKDVTIPSFNPLNEIPSKVIIGREAKVLTDQKEITTTNTPFPF